MAKLAYNFHSYKVLQIMETSLFLLCLYFYFQLYRDKLQKFNIKDTFSHWNIELQYSVCSFYLWSIEIVLQENFSIIPDLFKFATHFGDSKSCWHRLPGSRPPETLISTPCHSWYYLIIFTTGERIKLSTKLWIGNKNRPLNPGSNLLLWLSDRLPGALSGGHQWYYWKNLCREE